MRNAWGEVFRHYVGIGHDHADAAYRADQWEKRQKSKRWARCPSTHCERRQECAAPNDCCAALDVNEHSKGKDDASRR